MLAHFNLQIGHLDFNVQIDVSTQNVFICDDNNYEIVLLVEGAVISTRLNIFLVKFRHLNT